MITTIGWIASALFALCGAPQAYKSYKDGQTTGISKLFLHMWLWGEILMVIYVLGTIGIDGPLLVNYLVNILFIVIIMKYMYFPRDSNVR